jgi:GNAT superfamily N-acetyltransferase
MTFSFRPATRDDVPKIVGLLADDALGAQRERFEDPLPQSYYDAFDQISGDPNHELTVVESGGEVVGTLQLSILPYLTYQGGSRAQIEAVRIASHLRGSGLGTQVFEWAIERARERGCHLVQLTTDKSRPDALRFYEKLGFKASHEGMKLWF